MKKHKKNGNILGSVVIAPVIKVPVAEGPHPLLRRVAFPLVGEALRYSQKYLLRF